MLSSCLNYNSSARIACLIIHYSVILAVSKDIIITALEKIEMTCAVWFSLARGEGESVTFDYREDERHENKAQQANDGSLGILSTLSTFSTFTV